ncbi:MAG: hypothetical protein LBC19_06385 [Tannerella sp.]|jgi:hypothetical protein|nr:hypothetical protein [Tannerella sp.]
MREEKFSWYNSPAVCGKKNSAGITLQQPAGKKKTTDIYFTRSDFVQVHIFPAEEIISIEKRVSLFPVPRQGIHKREVNALMGNQAR